MSYRQLFDEAIGDAPPSGVDLDRVIRRQRRVVRTRPVLAGIALVALAAGTATFVARGDERPVLDPADELAGFSRSLEGTHVIVAESAHMADRTLTLTFTPSRRDLVLWARCDSPVLSDPNLGLRAEFSAGAGTEEVDYCSGDRVQAVFVDWPDPGMELGQPVTITVTLTAVAPQAIDVDELPPLPDEGTFALAVAEPVPFEEYELPPRPEVLEPLPDPMTEGILVELRPDLDDPNRPVEQTFRWDDAPLGACATTQLELISQTPGRMRVVVGDLYEGQHIWWDYGQDWHVDDMPPCQDVAGSDEVTIRVEPERMTGAWQVILTQRGG